MVTSRRLGRRLQPPGAAFGARDAQPDAVPGEPRTYAAICLGNRRKRATRRDQPLQSRLLANSSPGRIPLERCSL